MAATFPELVIYLYAGGARVAIPIEEDEIDEIPFGDRNDLVSWINTHTGTTVYNPASIAVARIERRISMAAFA